MLLKYLKKSVQQLLILFFFIGCSKSTLVEYRAEGEAITISLIQELRKVRSREQLIAHTAKLESLFEQLVDVMIAAQEIKQKSVDLPENDIKVASEISNKLWKELNRLYQIEGCRQILEKCEESALQRLDLYEKRLGNIANSL